ncbi:Tumor necrosis factor receptor superfamily member 19 OS=Ureibacillus acetophenoni OX=614649 GN=SAMN05877842_102280 PE=4 SV=1 [Ureibacillus acetophenoni]
MLFIMVGSVIITAVVGIVAYFGATEDTVID